MTKTTKCTECESREIYAAEMCAPCFEYAGWENQHQDEQHDSPPRGATPEMMDTDQCPVCHPELDPRNKGMIATAASKQQSNDNASGKHFSHKNCAHASTKSARALCRKQMRTSESEKIKHHREITVSCPTCHANISENEPCMTRTGKIAKQSHADRPSK